MTTFLPDMSRLPYHLREPFERFAGLLCELAGDTLLGLTAFGGVVVGDPFYANTGARSVVILHAFNLKLLDRLAEHGETLGRRGIAAPLIMTPEYIDGSRDVFPLELLEIQQLHIALGGSDLFAQLSLAAPDLRLQAERELKSELLHLRQGLIAAGGRRLAIEPLIRNCVERTVRVLRGVLRLCNRHAPQISRDVLQQAAAATGLSLRTVSAAAQSGATPDFAAFERFYHEVESIAAYVDRMNTS